MNDSPVDVGIVRQPGNAVTPVTGEAFPIVGITGVPRSLVEQPLEQLGRLLDAGQRQPRRRKPRCLQRGHYAVGNLLYTPVPNVMVGGELQWARRENFSDGFSSDGLKFQFSFKYNFSVQARRLG